VMGGKGASVSLIRRSLIGGKGKLPRRLGWSRLYRIN
jgi:hypothetical protein